MQFQSSQQGHQYVCLTYILATSMRLIVVEGPYNQDVRYNACYLQCFILPYLRHDRKDVSIHVDSKYNELDVFPHIHLSRRVQTGG